MAARDRPKKPQQEVIKKVSAGVAPGAVRGLGLENFSFTQSDLFYPFRHWQSVSSDGGLAETLEAKADREDRESGRCSCCSGGGVKDQDVGRSSCVFDSHLCSLPRQSRKRSSVLHVHDQ